jgi:hypothetical protein
MTNALVIATMTGRIIRPTAWAYDRILLDEARRLGIAPLPRVNALNELWRRHLEQQIGRKVVLGKLFRRKQGQRGPNKQYLTGHSGTALHRGTTEEERAQRREAYQRRKAGPYVVR